MQLLEQSRRILAPLVPNTPTTASSTSATETQPLSISSVSNRFESLSVDASPVSPEGEVVERFVIEEQEEQFDQKGSASKSEQFLSSLELDDGKFKFLEMQQRLE